MDVFVASEAMRDAAIEAAHELGVFAAIAERATTLDAVADALGVAGRARLRALLDVLVAIGVIDRRDDGFATRGPAPPRREIARAGWGLLADVIRADRPLAANDDDATRRFHRHLVAAGADAARELAPLLGAGPLLDLGGGAGAYTAAFLDARPEARAIVVDAPEVVALAAGELTRFGARVTLIAGDARTVALGDRHGAVLLANLLHLHSPAACAALCAVAASAVAPDGVVVIKDLRAGSLEGLLFALNMALYTEAGDVYDATRVRAWLTDAGLGEIEELQLASAPDSIVLIARRSELDAALARTGDAAWDELARSGMVRAEAVAPRLAFPTPLRRQLARAIAISSPTAVADLERHYLDVVPRTRVAQLASTAEPAATLFHTELAWSRLPRLTAALDRLFATLADAGADATAALGAASAAAFRARTRTLATLHERTHYGGAMPLLYGYPADLASFHSRGVDVHATIDRYLTAPIIHELCHFAPARAALEPLHLDECVGGWLGVHVHPEFAYPAPDCDDAIYAAPWLAQVGQAIARAFGIAAIVRAHAGTTRWDAEVPATFVATAARLGRDDWHARRTLHLLSDTFAPTAWIALALVAGAGRPLDGETLASLAATPLVPLATTLRDDPVFDRAIVTDALRAMCVVNARIDGTFSVRTAVPGAIEIDATTCRVTTVRRGDIDPVAPSYWLPPPVAARLVAGKLAGYTLHLGRIDALPDAAAAICAASPGVERDGVTLIARPLVPGLA